MVGVVCAHYGLCHNSFDGYGLVPVVGVVCVPCSGCGLYYAYTAVSSIKMMSSIV